MDTVMTSSGAMRCHCVRLHRGEDLLLSIRELAQQIRETGLSVIWTGHCTGQRAFDVLKEELGESLHQLAAGAVIDI